MDDDPLMRSHGCSQFDTAALRRTAAELDRVDWRGGSNGQSMIEDAADEIDQLRAELDDRTRVLDEIEYALGIETDYAALPDAVNALDADVESLKAALAEAQRDGERLDWLSEDHQRVCDLFGALCNADTDVTTRELIDAARSSHPTDSARE